MKRIFLIATLAGFTTTAAMAASSDNLNGPELRKVLSGKTIYLSMSGIVLPIAYRSNGTMSGRLKISTAALVGSGTSPQDTGRWWISKDQLCQKWKSWQSGKAYCYKLKRNGQNVAWVRDDGRRGTARIGS
jgi:hypothetical protein